MPKNKIKPERLFDLKAVKQSLAFSILILFI